MNNLEKIINYINSEKEITYISVMRFCAKNKLISTLEKNQEILLKLIEEKKTSN